MSDEWIVINSPKFSCDSYDNIDYIYYNRLILAYYLIKYGLLPFIPNYNYLNNFYNIYNIIYDNE